ncbi:preprotein translocase subunit SecE [Luteococcus peritonei]|uniref:Protein translocase subunit SecE n=1 Tax=Luteococcus peritonei TaxID=88874 RepID=A0ABW4RRC6_9ACTN
MSHDDAVDPSEPDFEVADHRPEPEADPEVVADQARRSRPRRRTAVPAQDQPADEQPAAERGEGGGATAARPVMPRPVRRTRPLDEQAAPESTGEADEPEDHTGSAAALQQVRPVRRSTEVEAAPARSRGGRQQATTSGKTRRTTPAAFVGQSADELRKVIWPTGSQLSQYFVVVLAFVLFIVAYVGVLDPIFGWVLLQAFGK